MAHHDHFRDGLDDIMQERARELGAVPSDAAAKAFIRRFDDALARFDGVLICGDCNAGNPDAKKIIGAPASLSFSPSEIRAMCDVVTNRPHIVDPARTRTVAERALALHDLRLKAAVRLADRAIRNEHWYEAADFESKPDQVEKQARRVADLYGGGVDLTVVAGGAPKSSIFDPWRRAALPAVEEPPTPEEIAYMATKDHSGWNQFADDWSCPCCRRAKAQAMSKTKKGIWQFKPASARFLEKQFVVYHDCNQTDRDFRQEVEKKYGLTDTSAATIALDQLRSIIIDRPFTKREIDSAAVEQLFGMFDGSMFE